MDNVDNKLFTFASELLLSDSELNIFPTWGKGISTFKDLVRNILTHYTKQLEFEFETLSHTIKKQEYALKHISKQLIAVNKLKPVAHKIVVDNEACTASEALQCLIRDTQEYLEYMSTILNEAQAVMSETNSNLYSKTISALVCQHAPNIIRVKNNCLKTLVKQFTAVNAVKNEKGYEIAINSKKEGLKKSESKITIEIEQKNNKIENIKKYRKRIETEIKTITIDNSR